MEIKLNDAVQLKVSGEKGVVIGCCEYTFSENQYFVHYKDGNGCAKTEWFYGAQLEIYARVEPEPIKEEGKGYLLTNAELAEALKEMIKKLICNPVKGVTAQELQAAIDSGLSSVKKT